MEYLEEKYPNTHRLLPGGPEKLAKIRALALMAQRWIEASFDAIEKELDKSSGKYSVGDDITLAGVCLVPQVSKANRYPNIKRVNDVLLKVPAFAFQNAHPDNQPDAEKRLS